MSVVEHPSQPKSPFDPARFQTQEDVANGVPVTKGANPWRWLALVTPDFVARAFPLYQPFAGDHMDWTSFAQKASSALVLTRNDGWLAFDNVVPGLSVQVHGGKYADVDHVEARDQETREALDLVMETLQVPMIKAYIPEHARGARLWARNMGFMEFGTDPLAGIYAQAPRNIRIFGYTGSK